MREFCMTLIGLWWVFGLLWAMFMACAPFLLIGMVCYALFKEI